MCNILFWCEAPERAPYFTFIIGFRERLKVHIKYCTVLYDDVYYTGVKITEITHVLFLSVRMCEVRVRTHQIDIVTSSTCNMLELEVLLITG
jgi:hypothetical protein